MIQLFKGFDADSIRTDVGAIARREVAAVSLFRRERLWDGTLRGAGIGAGKAVTMTAGLGGMKEDYAVAALLGSLTGAGLGALYDAAVARPDIPVFVNSPAGQPRPLTRAWQLRVARDELGGWVAGKDIQLMLKDGAFLRGKVSDVGEGKLSMQVKESSDPSLKNERLEVEIARIGAITLRERMGAVSQQAPWPAAFPGSGWALRRERRRQRIQMTKAAFWSGLEWGSLQASWEPSALTESISVRSPCSRSSRYRRAGFWKRNMFWNSGVSRYQRSEGSLIRFSHSASVKSAIRWA